MVINSLKAVFFIAGGAVVAGGAAYVTGALDGFLPRKPAEIASLPSPQPVPTAVQPQAVAPKVDGGVAPALEEAATPQEAQPEVVVPTFDIVRVEPDGSLVIAGRAAPVANIEIVTGATAIGRGETNESGEFAIVLDRPLKPGDYTIVLRSTTRDAIVATSSESAIVSIPEHPSGQVLALVEQPGAPSRLITVPEAPARKQDRPTASEQPVAEAPAGSAAQKETPSASAQREAIAQGEVSDAEGEPVGADTEEEDLAGAPAVETPTAEEPQVAAAAPALAREQVAVQAGAQRIAVEAVEIEGSRVFVAGRAEVGSRVRVYANDILLGDAQTSDGGRFLVEAERDLPVGDYIVRADLLGRNGEVLARAAVPFAREPGESVAAVAALEQPAVTHQPAPQAQAPQAQSDGAAAGSGAGQASAQQEVASAPAAPVATDSAPAAQSETAPNTDVTGPKLQSVAGSVIIRRGDTLWHISKRVYGQGVRYTTIYLANQDQIADPDRIWPGQIFSVPDKTDRGEDADMSTIADRMPEGQAETR